MLSQLAGEATAVTTEPHLTSRLAPAGCRGWNRHCGGSVQLILCTCTMEGQLKYNPEQYCTDLTDCGDVFCNPVMLFHFVIMVLMVCCGIFKVYDVFS